MTRDQFLAKRAILHHVKTVGVVKCEPVAKSEGITVKPSSSGAHNWKAARIVHHWVFPTGDRSSLSGKRREMRQHDRKDIE